MTQYTYSTEPSRQTGNATAVTDAKGKVTNNMYNPQNGRLELTYKSSIISIDPAYTNGNLASITRGGHLPNDTDNKKNQVYNFLYDIFGNNTWVSIGAPGQERTLASYTYAPRNGQLTSMSYGNGDSTAYTYDTLDRISSILYDSGKKYNYTYTGEGQLHQVKSEDGTDTAIYDYDSIGRLIHFDTANTNTGITQNFRNSYDTSNRLKGFGYIGNFSSGASAINQYETYTYNTDGTLAAKRTGSGNILAFDYNDPLKRLTTKTLKKSDNQTVIFKSDYTYTDGLDADATTALVSGLTYRDSSNQTLRQFSYTYDELGNITSVTDSNGETTADYTYDGDNHELNQLTSESLQNGNITYDYTYDTYGNILTVTSNHNGTGTTNTYSYDDSAWLDLLTSYNGNTITYDNIGNPLSYYDGTSMTWQNGRQLASLTKNDKTTSYTYNSDGIRSRKAVDGVTHDYILDGTRILADYSTGSEITFSYDENNVPVSFTYNGTTYNYITNLQGDIIEIRDGSNNVVGSYVYNAYGKIESMSGTMAAINPLRYRGYYYDSETGFYSLQSRYYDPTTGRFLNADATLNPGTGLVGMNLFAYCNNNPVNMTDSTGHFPFLAITAIAGAVIGAVAGGIIAAKTGHNVWAGIGLGAAGGALLGLGIGAGLAMISGASAGVLATTGEVMAGLSTVASTQINNITQAVSKAAPAVTNAASKASSAVGKGYNSFKQLKAAIGPAGEGNEWHHIVEQSQIAKSGFTPQMINNINNIVSISQNTHRAISGYYSSIQSFSEGMRVRDWLAGQSFQSSMNLE